MQIGKAGDPVSHICQAYPNASRCEARSLRRSHGRLTFTEYFHLLLTGREPSEDQPASSTCCSSRSPSTG